MTQEQLKDVLLKHKLWLECEEGGEKADLHGEDLRGTDLHWADLVDADLHDADLRDTDLVRADLRWACLRGSKMYKDTMDEASLTKRQRDSITIVKEA